MPRKKKIAPLRVRSANARAAMLRALLDADVEPEFRFHDTRRWRFDYALPTCKIAIEVEGGVWTAGRHTRPRGFLGDMEKYNAAAALGWRVLRATPDGLFRKEFLDTVRDAMSAEAGIGGVWQQLNPGL